jgi:hypothetical protein
MHPESTHTTRTEAQALATARLILDAAENSEILLAIQLLIYQRDLSLRTADHLRALEIATRAQLKRVGE